MSCDAVTVAPYMGNDSVTPFFEFENRWVILLALTSNEGALDFQFIKTEISHQQLWQKVVSKAVSWGNATNMMFVVGATRPEMFKEIRKIAPDHFYLVPGVGAQGGSVAQVAQYGMIKDCGLLINSSRGIIYAGSGIEFQKEVRKAAQSVQQEMALALKTYGVL